MICGYANNVCVVWNIIMRQSFWFPFIREAFTNLVREDFFDVLKLFISFRLFCWKSLFIFHFFSFMLCGAFIYFSLYQYIRILIIFNLFCFSRRDQRWYNFYIIIIVRLYFRVILIINLVVMELLLTSICFMLDKKQRIGGIKCSVIITCFTTVFLTKTFNVSRWLNLLILDYKS